MPEIDRKEIAILRVLDQSPRPLGAGKIAKELRSHGIELEERAVRYHLEALDQLGLTEALGRPGRQITPAGRRELAEARVTEKVGLVISRLESYAYLTTFNSTTGTGHVALNVSFVPSASLSRALQIMRPVLNSWLATSRRIRLFGPGERVGNRTVPPNSVGIGTVCAVALNGIILKAGIPIQSVFGGLLAVERNTGKRFTEVVHYGGTSLDPVEVFIKSGATSVGLAISQGSGVVGAGFREVPAVARDHVLAEVEKAKPWGITGLVAVGNPSSPLYEVEVGPGRCGLVIAAGLNPVAAVEEAGIPTTSHALTALYPYEELVDANDLRL